MKPILETVLEKPKQQRYIEPFSFELEGKFFVLETPEKRRFLKVLDEEFLEWKADDLQITAQYRAQKLCEDLFLLTFASGITAVSLALDFSTDLFTEISDQGIEFGRIRCTGRKELLPLHSFCSDLAGHTIAWRYSPEDCIAYLHTENNEVSIEGEEGVRKFCSVLLREDFYLLCYEIAPEKGNCLMLADLNKVHGVGRYLKKEKGTVTADYFAGYGDFVRPKGESGK